jgi:uncharacterized protein YbjT (DUF2867 family)
MMPTQLSGKILVTGGSGTTGSRVATQLAGRGVAVIAANRSGAGPGGVPGIRFDWYDSSTHDAALAGAECVYLVAPSRDVDAHVVMLPFLQRARAAGVRRAVLLNGLGTGAVHQAIGQTFDEWAALLPSWFMQNVTGNHPHARNIRASHTITTATGDGRIGFVDAYDIARVAVEALLSPTAPNAELILTGPETLSYDEVAAILTEVCGQSITHVKMSVAELGAFFEAAGLPPPAARLLAAADEAIAAGIYNRTTDTVARITGSAPRSFRAFAAAEFSL